MELHIWTLFGVAVWCASWEIFCSTKCWSARIRIAMFMHHYQCWQFPLIFNLELSPSICYIPESKELDDPSSPYHPHVVPKPQNLIQKSCDLPFQQIRILEILKYHTYCEISWDFTPKNSHLKSKAVYKSSVKKRPDVKITKIAWKTNFFSHFGVPD